MLSVLIVLVVTFSAINISNYVTVENDAKNAVSEVIREGTDEAFEGGGPGGGGGWHPQTSASTTGQLTAGTYTITGLNLSIVLTQAYANGARAYSTAFTKGNTYTLSNGTTSYEATAS